MNKDLERLLCLRDFDGYEESDEYWSLKSKLEEQLMYGKHNPDEYHCMIKSVWMKKEQENKELKEQIEKLEMDKAVRGSFKDDVEATFSMNDIDNLEDLDIKYNNLKQKLEKIKELKILKFLNTARHDLKKHENITIGGMDFLIEQLEPILEE